MGLKRWASGPRLTAIQPLPAMRLAVLFSLLAATSLAAAPIDRQAVVERHTIRLTRVDVESPLSVGNGDFAFTVDPTGAVSRAEYDAEGRLTRDTRYAQPIDLAGLGMPARTRDIGSRLVPRPGQDAVETRRYTRDGRLHYTVDGTGAVVEFKYDANGNVVERIGYAKAINLATWTGNTDPTVVADTARDQHVRTTYDALNRATHVADGMGGVTGYTYDTHGNLIRQTHYATAIAANAAPSSVTASASDQVTRFSRDTLGRPT